MGRLLVCAANSFFQTHPPPCPGHIRILQNSDPRISVTEGLCCGFRIGRYLLPFRDTALFNTSKLLIKKSFLLYLIFSSEWTFIKQGHRSMPDCRVQPVKQMPKVFCEGSSGKRSVRALARLPEAPSFHSQAWGHLERNVAFLPSDSDQLSTFCVVTVLYKRSLFSRYQAIMFCLGGRHRTLIQWFTSQMPTSQELGTPIRCPRWVAGAHLPQPSVLAPRVRSSRELGLGAGVRSEVKLGHSDVGHCHLDSEWYPNHQATCPPLSCL